MDDITISVDVTSEDLMSCALDSVHTEQLGPENESSEAMYLLLIQGLQLIRCQPSLE